MNGVFFNNFIYDNDYYTHLINYDCQKYGTRNRRVERRVRET